MRKTRFAPALVAGLCLTALAGCGAPALSDAGTSGAETVGNSSLRITAQSYEKEYRSDDGVLLGEYSFSFPSMSAASSGGEAEAAVELFNGDMDSLLESEIASWDEAMEEAADIYADYGSSGSWENGMYWSSEISYTQAQTGDLLSLCFEHYVYSGGAHGYTYYTSYLFDTAGGKEVSLSDLTDDLESLSQTVTDELLRQIDEKDLKTQYDYWDDYADYVAEWSSGYSVSFTAEGELQIIFPAYDLAPYAAGTQTFCVAQDVYADSLNDYGQELLDIS